MQEVSIISDVDVLKQCLGPAPMRVAKPVLIVVSGLPGTGKTHFSRCLAERVSLAVLETDAMRKALFQQPAYSAEESARLFRAVHQLIWELLQDGIPTLLDATNLIEAHREQLYSIAARADARLILVRMEAPSTVVQERLKGREEGTDESFSDADWRVYQRMRPSADPIRRNHFVVNSSEDIRLALDKVVREIRRSSRISA